MGRLFLVWLLLLASLLAGCAAQNEVILPATIPAEKCDLPAWEIGDYWKYRFGESGWNSWKVVEVTETNYILEIASDKDYKWVFDKKTFGLKEFIDSQGKTVVPMKDFDLFLDFPVYVGKKWDRMVRGTTTRSTDWNYLISYSVLSNEDVTVPAGTFRAFKIKEEQKDLLSGGSVIIHYWFSPEVKNIIKFKFVTSYGNWLIRLQDYELESYKSGAAYGKQGEYDRAIADFNRAIELNPKDAVAYYNRGNVYRKKGEYHRAISDYSKALEINPEYTLAYKARGITYGEKEEYDRAIADYNRAIELNANDALAYFGRGYIYEKKREYDQAISNYDKAIEIDPKFGLSYNNRGVALSKKKEYDKAIADYSKAIQLNSRYDLAYCNRGYAYYGKGLYDQAISDYSKAIEINPRFAAAYNRRGLAYSVKGLYDNATDDYNKAIEIKPDDSLFYNNLAWLLATAKVPGVRDGRKAIELALKACQLSDWKNPGHLDTLAAAYARVNDFDNAVKWQEKALESPGVTNKKGMQQRLDLYKERKPWPID